MLLALEAVLYSLLRMRPLYLRCSWFQAMCCKAEMASYVGPENCRETEKLQLVMLRGRNDTRFAI